MPNDDHQAVKPNLIRMEDLSVLDPEHWDVRHKIAPTVSDDTGEVHSMSCVARRRSARNPLVLDISVSRGDQCVLLGTSRPPDQQPDNWYPFEDVAVHYGWRGFERLQKTIDEVPKPLVPLREALRMLNDNAASLQADLAPGERETDNALQDIARRFHALSEQQARREESGRCC